MGGFKQTTQQGEGSVFHDSSIQGRPEEKLAFILLQSTGETYAIEIGKVREIIRVPHITWLPGVPNNIRGVINLRGTVVAVVDLAVLLSHPVPEIGPKSRIVIAESSGATVGMLVDSVTGVAELPPAALEPAMRTLDELKRSLIVAQGEVEGNLVGILDVDHIVEKARPAAVDV